MKLKRRKKLKYIKSAGALLLTAALAGLVSCAPNSSGMSGLTLPSIAVRGLPVNTAAMELTVSAPDMATISRSIDPAGGSVTLEVPAGSAREFSLSASNASVTTSGTAVRDLQAGSSVEIPLSLRLAETKLIVPDNQNSRIVQLDDMAGNGWIEKGSADVGLFSSEMYPWRIDFDDFGRIYAAISGGDTNKVVFRLDHINDTSSEVVVENPVSSGGQDYTAASVFTVDRNSGVLYVPGTSSIGSDLVLLAFSLDDLSAPPTVYNLSTEASLSFFSDFNFAALAVDSSGILYALISYEGNEIYKLDLSLPEGSRVVDSVFVDNISPAADMIVKDGKVYVAGTSVIRRYGSDLVQEGADLAGNADETDFFLDIWGFLKYPGGGFLVMDIGGQEHRLVSFDDFTGAGWTTFSASDIGETDFSFVMLPVN